MKMHLFLLCFLLSFNLNAQINAAFKQIEPDLINLGVVDEEHTAYDEEFSQLDSLFKGVDIVFLGEQSHGEATTYLTKIKLIKYLHQKLGFDLLLFESGFFDCHKANELIREGKDVRKTLAKSVFSIWSLVKEFKPLTDYIEQSNTTDNKLEILGFDNQFSGSLSQQYFIKDLTEYLKKVDSNLIHTKEWQHFVVNIEYVHQYNVKELKKNQPGLDTTYINALTRKIEEQSSTQVDEFWIYALKNAKYHLCDLAFRTYYRDWQMADNFAWIKNKYPNRKIICWGATSHFLYNAKEVRMRNIFIQMFAASFYQKHPTMGTYLQDKYGSSLLNIGFTAYEGVYGLGKPSTIKPPKKGTIEWLIGQSEHDNLLLPLKNLETKKYICRALGNYYMVNDFGRVMDAIIFNRKMEQPHFDRAFIKELYPKEKKETDEGQ